MSAVSRLAGNRARNPVLRLAQLLLPLGWVLVIVGYYGPWIAHKTAALTLTGSDMGEFVKFLPGVLDGSLQVVRQFFYLPPVAVSLTVALLVGNRSLGFPWLLRVGVLSASAVMSFQLLPPAWSPGSLMTAEFRLQPIALGFCWLALGGFWLLGRLPIRLTGLACCGLAILAGALAAWQMLIVKPAINATYGAPPAVGWGCAACFLGLAMLASAGAVIALFTGDSRHGQWL